jgi:adenylate cyclase
MFVHWLKHLLFVSPDNNMLIGEVLTKRNVVSATDLKTALDIQKERLNTDGKAIPLGRIIVELGLASEKDLVSVINDHYKVSIASLSENTRDWVEKDKGFFSGIFFRFGWPIWFQLSVTMMLILLSTIGGLFFFIAERQEEHLKNQAMDMGMVSLHFFGKNAGIPMLNEDILALNTLLKNAEGVDGHLYAFVTNNEKIIMAHTDQSKIGTLIEPFNNIKKITKNEDVTSFDYVLAGKGHVLDMSTPILFDGKELGEIHVGLSVNFINQLFVQEKSYLALCTLAAAFVALIVAVIFGVMYSRPISLLVRATREISKGNYQHRVTLKRNDELGRLAKAFNRMGSELARQAVMKETFGKYVGTEVLDMIMIDPKSQWLKGRKNEASILFADVRGFTAYSETKDPEQIVEKLNEYFDIATQVILKHGGYIDKFIGDAVLGVFGVPVFCEDHSERCVRAAVEMQNEFKKASGGGNELLSLVGIGLKTGVVVAGNIGSQSKMEYTVVGDSVNIASKLNGFAMPGEIIADDSVCYRLKEKLDYIALAPQKIKGRMEPVQIFKILGFKTKWKSKKS